MRRLVQCVVWILLWYVPTWAVDLVTVKERTVTQLAPGVYEIRHPDAPDTFPNSNTTVIIGGGDYGVAVAGAAPHWNSQQPASHRCNPNEWINTRHASFAFAR